MTRKYSYRTLAKRTFASNVLAYLKNPKLCDASFDYSMMSEREANSIRAAFGVAAVIKEYYKKGKSLSLKSYAPYVNEIKQALLKN